LVKYKNNYTNKIKYESIISLKIKTLSALKSN
jgi:hypothetical protein